MTDTAMGPAAGLSATELETAAPVRTPGQLFWRQFHRNSLAVAGLWLLGILYGVTLLAPFLAPYSENDIDRNRFYHPPTPIRWVDAEGKFHGSPFIYASRELATSRYEEDRSRILPIRFFVKAAPYRLWGLLPLDRHLYGVAEGERIFIMGADHQGRCVWTRLLFGAQISLSVGLIGIAISFTLGMLLGGISGYFGGWIDAIVMRFVELLLSIPGLYLIVALRGVFPNDLPSEQIYLAIIAILAFIGWAGLARVIRGMVLSIRKADYVAAAEALGMSRMRIIVRHILPNTLSYVIVAATIAVPGYILGEVFLSFLGVGVQEPSASWGNMLNQARSLAALRYYPWMLFVPGVAIFLTVMAYNFFGDGLRDALDPRKTPGGKG